MVAITKAIGDPLPFLRAVTADLERDGIDTVGLRIGHICYRSKDQRTYLEKRNSLLENKVGKILSEKQVGGRPITVFNLSVPIEHMGNKIQCLELPALKSGTSYADGYEHVCFVVGSLEKFMKTYPWIVFNTEDLQNEENPMVEIRYSGGYRAKFATKSLSQMLV